MASEDDQDSASVNSTLTISGYVYKDQNHNSSKESSEGGLGTTVYVKLCQGGSVVQVVAANQTTGYYQFNNVNAGTYSILEDTDNNTGNCTPSDPNGYISTTSNQISVNVTRNTYDINFGDFYGTKISGNVFYDKGDGSSISTEANNAVFDSSEDGIMNVKVKACQSTSCSSVLDSNYTDLSGRFELWISGDTVSNGSSVYILEEDLNGYTSTGDSIGTTVDSSSVDNLDERNKLIYIMNSGEIKDNYNFGDVEVIQITPPQSYSVSAGNSLRIKHTINIKTPGKVSVMLASQEGWTYSVYDDVNCDENPDGASITPISGYYPLNNGNDIGVSNYCVIIRTVVPNNTPNGTTENLTVMVYEDWKNTPTGNDDSDSVLDTIIVSNQTSGALRLEKFVRNLSQGESFSKNNNAKPGEILEYKIYFKNIGSKALKNITFGDTIPDYTQFYENQYNSHDVKVYVEGNVYYGDINDSPDVDGVRFNGTSLEIDLTTITNNSYYILQPGQEGYFLFQVQVK